MRCRIRPGLFGAIILGLSLLPAAHARAEQLCAEGWLAKRAVSESCWASFALGPRRKLCFPHSTWLEYLKHAESTPCGDWLGKWKAGALPDNDARDRGD